ncbi:DNA polymerase [Moraxella atlantae]|uniref:DNA polymerase n=1 Tax=Faucicola atlantae TaxID=34059 RepID=UPI0037524C5E
MNHIIYKEQDSYEIAILIKETYLDKNKISQFYLNKINPENVIIFGLPHTEKMTVSNARKQLTKLLPTLVKLGVSTLYVADATYFKALTKQSKAEQHIGYVLPCTIKDYEHINVILGINYGQLFYNPNLISKLELSIDTLVNHINGYHNDFDIIKTAIYDETKLVSLHQYTKLTCDIETSGLSIDSDLISIAFAWSKHEGIAFKVTDKLALKRFFQEYKGQLIFHNATFDIKLLIRHLFMKNDCDIDGLLYGLHTLCKNMHDTKIIAYLATNNTQGNNLGLKNLSHEYVGNYAVDFNQVTDEQLLEYNLKDCLATYYVFEKYYPKLLQDNQLDIYQSIMLPSIKTIIQMELVGMPIDMNQVKQSRQDLEDKRNEYLHIINSNPYIQQTTKELQQIELNQLNAKLKTKQHGLDKVADYQFNPASTKHLQYLLYTILNLPVLDYTVNKQPATGTNTLEKLLNHTDEHKELINAFIGLNQVNKILTTFIPALEQAIPRDNWYYLHGNFNLGGTLSGRMSSSNPNLQNLPSNSIFGKLIKQCFSTKKGWLMVGADFSSLEDRINALLTKDSNKLKVYSDGYDGHSLRAYYYWKPKGIKDTVESINSIKNLFPNLRQASKAPTFALTYGGTYITLMNNCGFSEQEAKEIEANYHELYKQSDQWVAGKIALAEQQGYIDSAFGLRIRTPIIAKSVLNTSKTPHKATAEARSVANAISGQSYGLLTNRAINAFMELVWASEYRNDIMPICLIHDAIYLMIKDDIRVIEWVNHHLIQAMQWQELEEIKHDAVHLEAELDIYYPSWANPITLPNNISQTEIKDIVKSNIK